MAAADKEALEAHLLLCESCQGELDFMRLMVAGLRSLPAPHAPPDFQSRVLARWKQEAAEPVAPELVAVGATPRLVAVPPPTPPALPEGVAWTPHPVPTAPPRRGPAYAIKPFYGLAAALFAVIFAVGMLTGKNYYGPEAVKTAGLVPNLRQVADQLKENFDLTLTPSEPKAAAAVNECSGKTNEWNPTQVRMVVRAPLNQQLHQAELAVWVPENVRVAFESSEYSSGQLLLIPVNVSASGEWQGSLRWIAVRPGRFNAWVETRCEGVYQHRNIVFNAMAP